MSRRRGFTLVEVLMAALLVAVAVTAVMGGLRALGQADVKVARNQLLQRLVTAKANEVLASTDPSSFGDGGDFTDAGYPDITWTIDVQTSGATDVDEVTVAATLDDDEQFLTFLQYVRPLTAVSE